jgi:hypothetical protein
VKHAKQQNRPLRKKIQREIVTFKSRAAESLGAINLSPFGFVHTIIICAFCKHECK